MLLEVNTVNFLYKLSLKYKNKLKKSNFILKLRDVPQEEWERITYDSTVKYIWLMGVWKRSRLSRKITLENIKSYIPLLEKPEEKFVLGSAYSIVEYIPDKLIGSFRDLLKVKKILNKMGIGLILDFVPNHLALDNIYLSKKIFVEVDFEKYLKNPDLFYILPAKKGFRYIAFGKDPFFPPWKDTLQINIFSKEAQKILLENLKKISYYADGVRVDMAMLLLKDIFYNNWKEYLKEEYLKENFMKIKENFNEIEEFWYKATKSVDLIFIAECYWQTENKLLNLGFHYTYDKRFLDAILNQNLQEIKYLISLNPEFQKRMVRFLENHDEERIANKLNEYNSESILTLFFTTLGLKMVYYEQFEGQTVRIPVQLLATKDLYKPLPIYPKFIQIYKKIKDFLEKGKYAVFKISPIFDDSAKNLLAYGYKLDPKILIIVINFSSFYSQGVININETYPQGVFTFQNSENSSKKNVLLTELIKGERYYRNLENLHVILQPYKAHIFLYEE